MQMSHHAAIRSRERRLPSHILQTICEYGAERHSRGALSLTLDRASIALAADGNPARACELDRYRGAYVVLSDAGVIITVARRTRRFRN